MCPPTVNRLGIIAVLAMAAAGPAQDAKPDEGKGKVKTVEATVAGRKVALTVPEGWTEWRADAAPDPSSPAGQWKLAAAWKSGTFEELTLRVFGVEKAGVTATKVRDAWFEHATSQAKPGISVRSDVKHPKDRNLTGHDLEVDLKSDDGKAWVWIRTLNLAKDKVAVLFAEARPLHPPEPNPLGQETFVREPQVLEILPVLSSFRNKATKESERWIRGSAFEMARGPAKVTMSAPKDWSYTRLGPEGSVIWMSPDSSDREFIVGMSVKAGAGGADMMRKAERMLVEASGGKVYEDREIEGADGGHEFISASKLSDRSLWSWRRVHQRGEITVSILAKVPVTDPLVPPGEDVQKEARAFFEGIRLGK